MSFSELYQFLCEIKKLILHLVTLPIKPTDLVVLTISVVVAVLCPTPFISAANHWHALGKEKCGEKISSLTIAQRIDLRIISRTFDAAIPGLIIVVAIAVIVLIQLIVLFVVADQIGQCESIVSGDKVDAGVRPPAVMIIEIRASGESIRHLTNPPFIAFPKTAD